MSKGFVEQLVVMADRRRPIDAGGHLFHRGDMVSAMFIVREGAIELTRPQENGALLVLQRAGRSHILAEASLYSAVYHCDAVATQPSEVDIIDKDVLTSRLRDDMAFARGWSSHLAREVQAARYRSEILARRTVAERLDAWLVWQGGELPPKGEWKSLAAQLGVSPEALYRELSKRR